jgi:hypothetical protein
VQVVAIRMTHMRGCIALVLRYEREVRASIKTLLRTRAPWATALAGLLQAGLAHAAADTDGAVAHVVPTTWPAARTFRSSIAP